MTSAEINDVVVTTNATRVEAPQSSGPGLMATLWARWVRQLEDRRTLHRLYQLDARILRDMGFDPDAIYKAREGAIGERDGHRYRSL